MTLSIWLYICNPQIIIAICCTCVLISIVRKSLKIYCLTSGFLVGLLAIYINIKVSTRRIDYGEQKFLCYIVDRKSLDSTKYENYKYRYKCKLLGKGYGKNLLLKSNNEMINDALYKIHANVYTLSRPVTPYSKDIRYIMFFRDIIGFGEILEAKLIKAPNRNPFSLVNKNLLYLHPNNAALLKGMTFGGKCIPEELNDDIQKAGLDYLFRISGLHFAVVSNAAYILGRWILSPFIILISPQLIMQHIGSVCALIGCVLYSSLADSSEVCSSLSTIIPIFSSLYLNKIHAYYNTILSTILTLIVNPYAIAMPGMQLSVASSLTLIYIRNRSKILSTIVVGIVNIPIVLYWFGVSPIKNFIIFMLCVPIFTIVMPLSILAIFILPYSTKILDCFTGYFIKLIKWLSIVDIFEISRCIDLWSVIFWCIALILYFLIENKIYSYIVMGISLLTIFNVPNELVFIELGGRNIAIYDNGIVWALHPSSFHAFQCAGVMSTKSILPLKDHQYFMQNPQLICWHNVLIKITKNGRFKEACFRGDVLASRWQMSQYRKSCAIHMRNNLPTVIY